jgi:hypothetical protein
LGREGTKKSYQPQANAELLSRQYPGNSTLSFTRPKTQQYLCAELHD